jgi:hypothetical protein
VTRADNSHHLITAARTRSRNTRERTLNALQTMIDNGDEITFEAVVTRAGVSRSWLYSATDLRDRIIELRATTRPAPQASPAPRQPATEASLLTRLEVTQERLRQVTADNVDLRAQLEHALGVLRAERQGLSQRPPPSNPTATGSAPAPVTAR